MILHFTFLTLVVSGDMSGLLLHSDAADEDDSALRGGSRVLKHTNSAH